MSSSVRATILIVEDDERLADLLCNYLKKYLYAATAVSSVRAACEEIAQGRYDVLIQDWILPDGDGRTVLEFARSASPETVVVVYSAHDSTDAECTAAGAHQFVEKGHDVSHLRNAIERGLNEFRRRPNPDSTDDENAGRFEDLVWQLLGDRFDLDLLANSPAMLISGSESLACRFASWVARKGREPKLFRKVDGLAMAKSPDGIIHNAFGSCSLRGVESRVCHGLLDTDVPAHFHIGNCSSFPPDAMDAIVETAMTGQFQRAGSDRKTPFSGSLSFTVHDNGSYIASLRQIRDLPLISLPEKPSCLGEPVFWVQQLVSEGIVIGPADWLVNVLNRCWTFLSWETLFSMTASAAGESKSIDGDVLTMLPLFESAFTGSLGQISDWKSVADVPRFLYVSWLLTKTSGNIAEASRISQLSRAAIYATLSDRAPQ